MWLMKDGAINRFVSEYSVDPGARIQWRSGDTLSNQEKKICGLMLVASELRGRCLLQLAFLVLYVLY